MTHHRYLAIAALAGTLLLFGVAAPARQTSPTSPNVFYMGASETAGYGLPSARLAFPHLVASHCGGKAVVSATANVPTLLRNPRIPAGTHAVVIMLSQLDAVVSAPLGSVRVWIGRYVAAAPTLILTAPLVSAMGAVAPTVAHEQRDLYRRIARDAHGMNATVEALTVPASVRNDLQSDGIHPNARGERRIARVVQAWLRGQGACNS